MMTRTSLTTLGFVACLVVFPRVSTPAARTATPARMTPQLAAEVLAGVTRLPVIVHFRAPAAARVPLSERDHTPELKRRNAIEPLVKERLRALRARIDGEDLHVVRQLRLQPAVAAVVSPRGLGELLRSPAVELIEPDLRWRVHTEQGLPLIDATAVHNLGVTGEGVAVAVIDTGVDATHPALGSSPAPNSKVVYALDTADGDADASDCGVHGTAVAAVIAGFPFQWNPLLRFAGGVAPGAKILAYKASPDAECGSFSLSAVLAAMEDALLHRNDGGTSLAAINLSVGAGAFAGPCEGLSASYRHAVSDATAAGVAVVASAGNEGLADAMAAPACLGQVISVGSVWDTAAGRMGHSFCLDPGCTTVCDDRTATAATVTCYSNSSVALDLLAPSEYLTTARAGGQTLEFGGTSGAAAYVAGAIALLRAASAAPTPAGLRALLALTGQPIADRRSGRVRSLVDVAAALDHQTVVAAAAPEETDGNESGPILSRLEIAEPVVTGSLRVLLHLACDRPEQLVVRLVAPDGRAVLLHDRGPGSVPDVDGLTRFGGLWGTYPDELVPAESLGRLAGIEGQGVWTLEIGGPKGKGTDGLPGTLLDWALEITPRVAPSAPSTVIPAAAHLEGVDRALWTTDLRLVNPTSEARRVRLVLVPSGADGRLDFYQGDLRLPRGAAVDLPDVVRSVFGREQISGALFLASGDGAVLASSRTATIDGGGTYGQFIGPEDPNAASLGVAEPPLVIPHLENTTGFRTNLGFVETSGNRVSLSVRVVDGDDGGLVGEPLAFELEPFSHLQVRLRTPTPRRNLYAEVTAIEGEGRVMAYASTIDNSTRDASFVPAARPALVGQTMLPVVASAHGRGGTSWRSEVRLANLGSREVLLRLEYRPRQGEPGAMRVVETRLPGGRVLLSEDVVGELFGLTATAGSLRIVVEDGRATLLVSSRTANWTPRGSFGQYVGGVSQGLAAKAVVVGVDGGQDVRSNLGLCEVEGARLEVRCTLRDALGNELAPPALFTVEPYQLVQVNDIFAAFGTEPQHNARIDLAVESGTGAYAAYASVVDAVTGDAVFIPAQPLPD